MAVIFDIRRGKYGPGAAHVQGLVRARARPRRRVRVDAVLDAGRWDSAPDCTALLRRVFAAFGDPPAEYARNLKAIQGHLTRARGLPLSATRPRRHRVCLPCVLLAWIRRPLFSDVRGPHSRGVARSFLASDANFARAKALESSTRGAGVGDFAGPRAIRAIAAYLKIVMTRAWRRSTCPTSNSISIRMENGPRSATWRPCRSMPRAARPRGGARVSAWDSCRGSAPWPRRLSGATE